MALQIVSATQKTVVQWGSVAGQEECTKEYAESIVDSDTNEEIRSERSVTAAMRTWVVLLTTSACYLVRCT